MKAQPFVILLAGLGASVALAASFGAFAGCSSDVPPASNPGVDAEARDAAVDASEPPDATPAKCTITDIAPGTGTKFCDLPGTDVPGLELPAEFCIREYTTTPLTEARVLRFAPNGDLFVAAPSMTTAGGATDGPGSIVVLPDDDKDGKADAIVTYAGPFPRGSNTSCKPLEGDPNNLSCVHGLAFAGGYLYFTRSDEVRRVPYKAGDRAVPAGPGELVATLGGEAIATAGRDVRWTHTLEVARDGSLLVSRGRSDTNDCTDVEMQTGAVFAIHIEKGGPLPLAAELVTDGFRNPMYLRCVPGDCNDCYAAELSGDDWGGVGGREKLSLLAKGERWGYPCCVGRDMPGPGAPKGYDCSSVGRELVAIPLHDTPFGFDFERGLWPGNYKHGIFVALHGVITSYGGTGIVWMQTDPATLRPVTSASLFVKGFGQSVGRATDAVFAPDGRLFIADDTMGKIYWVAPRTLQAPK